MKPVLESINLAYGSHESPEEGLCLLEAVAYIAGEPHSDHPSCVCPVLAAFGRSWNDELESDDERNRLLRPLIPKLIGTNTGPEVSEKRAWIALDWLIRVHWPAWMDLTESLRGHAAILRALPEQTSEQEILASAAAREAAWEAALNAVRDSVRDFAGITAGKTVELATWIAVRATAGAAAGDAAGDNPWNDARTAAGDDAWKAARTAAVAAAGEAVRAATEGTTEYALMSVVLPAARDALNPTVEKLKESALELFNRMISIK